MRIRNLMFAIVPLAGLLGGCLVAAAGAGAGGAVYVTERDAEATLPASVAAVEASAKRTFGEMGITEKRTIAEEGSGGLKRTLEGTLDDRDISVAIQNAGTGAWGTSFQKSGSWPKNSFAPPLSKASSRSSEASICSLGCGPRCCSSRV